MKTIVLDSYTPDAVLDIYDLDTQEKVAEITVDEIEKQFGGWDTFWEIMEMQNRGIGIGWVYTEEAKHR